MTFPTKVHGSTNRSLPTFKRDAILADGVTGLFDFGPDYFRGGKSTLDDGDLILPVDGVSDSATVSTSVGIATAGSGLELTDDDDLITTNDGFLFPDTVQHCAVCVWVRVAGTGQDSGGSGILGVTGSSDQYRIYSTADGLGDFTGIGARFNGTSLVATSLLAAPDEVVQIVAEYKRESGREYLNLYYNAVLDRKNDKADVGLTAPSVSDKGIIGDGVIAFPVASKCRVYRAWAVNMDDYEGSLQNLIYSDYIGNKNRFS